MEYCVSGWLNSWNVNVATAGAQEGYRWKNKLVSFLETWRLLTGSSGFWRAKWRLYFEYIKRQCDRQLMKDWQSVSDNWKFCQCWLTEWLILSFITIQNGNVFAVSSILFQGFSHKRAQRCGHLQALLYTYSKITETHATTTTQMLTVHVQYICEPVQSRGRPVISSRFMIGLY